MNKNNKTWVIAADMGYGHQRTAYPLRDVAFGGKVININSYDGIPKKDKKFWQQTRVMYEFISRFKKIPVLGSLAFSILDRFQKILTYYPKRDLSRPTASLKNIFHFIKKGWGRDLIERLKKNPLPLVSTFFTPAFMAEEFGYKNDIYCVICDADIARAWAPLEPKKSKIKYFASNTWTRDRLKLYGVKKEKALSIAEAMLSGMGININDKSLTGSLPLGFKQRLALTCSLLHEPRLLFLDEPTSGVDPQARRAFWNVINHLAEQGKTIIVTTHFMDEAEYCHKVMIMQNGVAIAIGKPGELKAQNKVDNMQALFMKLVS